MKSNLHNFKKKNENLYKNKMQADNDFETSTCSHNKSWENLIKH